ncbi:hypothetical protein [Flavobacterium pectinovorum]|uniref:hypothetical protein n=1 Tax=Flavobacterium pectinovorum TaxID=29533 RepID=UPI001FAE3658|nr:hypothetical protein [Flavobacterium pectinovorum]MCI9843933.1 hypothetical protein [Flavobacterium pectinovorum]
MKKLIILFVIITSLTAFSCSNDNDEAKPSITSTNQLYGKWYYVSGISKTKADEIKTVSRIAETVKSYNYVEFKDRGSYAQGTQTGTIVTENSTSTWVKS